MKVVTSAGSRGSDQGLGTHGFTKTPSGASVRAMLAAVCNAGFSGPLCEKGWCTRTKKPGGFSEMLLHLRAQSSLLRLELEFPLMRAGLQGWKAGLYV